MVIIYNNEVKQKCGICGQESRMKLTNNELEAYQQYLSGGHLIQECLPALNRCEREFLKSGYCAGCQKLLFGNGSTKRIHK